MPGTGTTVCPKCGFPADGGPSCRRCGLVFERWRGEVRPREAPRSPQPPVRDMRQLAWVALAAVVTVAALAWLAVTQFGLRSAGPGPEEAFRTYRRALATGDPEAVRPLVVEAKRKELDGPDAASLLALAAAFAPADYELRAVAVDGNRAELQLAATLEGHTATGTARMAREQGRWLLEEERWEITFDAGTFPAEAPPGLSGAALPPRIRPIERLAGGERAAAFDALDPRVLGPGATGAVAAFNPAAGAAASRTVLRGHSDAVSGLAFSPDGSLIVTASYGDMSMRLWRVADGASLATTPTEWRVEGIAFRADGSGVVTLDAYCHLLAWPVSGNAFGAPAEIGLTAEQERQALARSPNGALLATVGGLPGTGQASVWDLAGASRLRHLSLDALQHAAAFSPAGRFLAVAGTEPFVTIHDLRRGEARRYKARGAGASSEIYGLAFSPDGAHLAAAHNDSTVTVWDVASGEQIHDFFVRDASAMDLAFSPDGRCLATAQADGIVYLWDAATARRLAALTGHDGEVAALAFSPAGDVLASGGRDGTAILWR